ncbi:MAG: sulfatase family protein [Planctomycetota bacterium]|jgi:arylsulfatase A-like enzyme
MTPFRRTAVWALATGLALYLLLTTLGVIFMAGHENELAKTILEDHWGAVLWLYLRLLLGYLVASLLVALLLHPIAPGWKAAPATLGIVLLGLIHTLTHETHLLYGPTQTLFCSVRDALPSFLRDLYRPWQIEAIFILLALVSLHLWTRKVPLRRKLAVAAVLAVAIGLSQLPAQAAAKKAEPACFLLIGTDSLRADHLSCNGYVNPGRPQLMTSPHIDALAARGTNFANCLVPTASTHESWITLFSSLHPKDHGLRHMFPSRRKVREVEERCDFFPELLKEKGYATAAIGGWCGTTFGLFDMGFGHVDVSNTQNHVALIAEAAFTNHLIAASFLDNPLGRLLLPELERVSFTRGAGAITRRAKAWMDRAAEDGRPFFLTVIYHVTHLPYSASHPYYTFFTDPQYRGRNRYRIDFKIDEMIQRGFEHDLKPEEMRHIVDLYDGCVKEFDDQVGALVAHLEALGLLDQTVVGVVADHGDDRYEHGTTLGHGVTLFGGDQANHIPAVFAGPGVPPRRVEGIVRERDLAPTWMTWLGYDAPESWQGVDLSGKASGLAALLETSYLLYRQPVPDLQEGETVKEFPRFDRATFLDPDFDHNIVLKSELEEMVVDTKCFAVREGGYKLIFVPGESGPIYRLFDLKSDPQCRRNLAQAQPEIFARLKRLLPEHAR